MITSLSFVTTFNILLFSWGSSHVHNILKRTSQKIAIVYIQCISSKYFYLTSLEEITCNKCCVLDKVANFNDLGVSPRHGYTQFRVQVSCVLACAFLPPRSLFLNVDMCAPFPPFLRDRLHTELNKIPTCVVDGWMVNYCDTLLPFFSLSPLFSSLVFVSLSFKYFSALGSFSSD